MLKTMNGRVTYSQRPHDCIQSGIWLMAGSIDSIAITDHDRTRAIELVSQIEFRVATSTY